MSSRHARRISTPLPYLGKLTLSAGVITDDTRLAGVEGDGKAYPDSSAGVWPAATNLCTNGNATTNTTGWGTSGGTVSRITTDHFFGSTCFEFAPSGLNDVSTFSKLVSGSTTYTISCWFKSPDLDIGFVVEEYDSGDGYLTGVYPTLTCAANERTYATITFTTNASTAYIVFGPQATESTGAIKFGGVQLEAGSIATPYIETDGGTASRSVGTIGFPSSLLSASAGTLAFRWKAGCPYTTTTRPRFMNWLSGNNLYSLYYDTGTDQFWFFRDNGSGSGDIVKSASQTFALGDTLTIQVRWSPTEIGIKVNTAAWVTLASTKVPSGLPATVGLGTTAETPIGSLYWVWASKAAISDSDSIQVAAQGNNDPLPHMLPKAASPSLLAPFNGDGTFYRRSA